MSIIHWLEECSDRFGEVSVKLCEHGIQVGVSRETQALGRVRSWRLSRSMSVNHLAPLQDPERVEEVGDLAGLVLVELLGDDAVDGRRSSCLRVDDTPAAALMLNVESNQHDAPCLQGNSRAGVSPVHLS